MATEAQYEALTASTVDSIAAFAVRWLAYDKANSLFALLFGIGFWVQMERLEARGADFKRIYTRRLSILLVFGFLHLFLLWPFEILHLYALAGFLLLALRNRSDRFVLVVGLALAIFGRPLLQYFFEVTGVAGPADERAYSDAAILARQAAATLFQTEIGFWRLVVDYYLVSGLIIAWLLYALGRFLLGAYIARKGWIQRSTEFLPQFRLVLFICLPIGLSGQFLSTTLELGDYPQFSGLTALDATIHFVSVLFLLAGYVSAILVLFHSRARPFVMVFAPVGRMALTNYVTQSFVIAYLAYQTFGGPALAGIAGPAELLLLALMIFLAQVAFSHLWLRRFAYGPLEWCWRVLTYGNSPRFLKQS